MTENKQKLIALVSALEEENIIDYCYTFIGLKVYGHARLPESMTAELRRLWEKAMLTEQQRQELREEPTLEEWEPEETTPGECEAMRHRCEIVKAVYGIENVAILNCIHVFVDDIVKEPESGVQVADERTEVIAELNKEVGGIRNITVMRFILDVVKSFKKNRKWGAV